MTKDGALRLALSTLNEVREETFRLLRNGQTLYAEKKVWDTIYEIKKALETKDEPVALVAEVHISRYTIEWTNGPLPEGTKLYTTPQRTWVVLTEEDLKLLSAEWRIVYGAWMDDFARDIEAKLKEKNT